MHEDDIRRAAELLVRSRRNGRFLADLPAELKPPRFADAAAIQAATAKLLGDDIVAYKVAGTDPATVIWGGILASRRLVHPATLPAASVPLLGVEAEIAYRLNVSIEARHRTMTMEQFDEMTTVIPAIEIVDSRFLVYLEAPMMDRNADFMSNGALIVGEPWLAADDVDFINLPVTLTASSGLHVETIGGHPAVDPRLPALAFLQAADRPDHLPAGTIVTTGTYTALNYANPGDRVSATFAGYGEIELTLTA